LAFLTVLARWLVNGGGVESALYTVWCSLLAFAVAGGAIGWLAEGVVRDSVNGQIEAEIAVKKTAKTS
jgi:hypothetical protein